MWYQDYQVCKKIQFDRQTLENQGSNSISLGIKNKIIEIRSKSILLQTKPKWLRVEHMLA